MIEYSKERASVFEPFIKYRIASNNWNEVYSETLLYFDRYCTENFPGVAGITQDIINGWCVQRPTETRLLRTENVDLQRGIINITETKGNQQHYVALHADTTRLLRDYDNVASKLFLARVIFFSMNPKNPDIPISPDMLDYHFHKVWDRVNE